MSLQFDNKIFFHVGKTGGTYIRSCINKSAPKSTIKEIDKIHTHPINHLPKKQSIWICGIREPLEWYQSYFRWRITKGWKKNHHVDNMCKSVNFNDFTGKMIKNFPFGYVSSLYARTAPFCDIVIDTKFLTKQLKSLFDQWNYYWYNSFTNKINVTDKKIPTVLSDQTKTSFLKIEQGAINLYKFYASKGIKN